MGISAWASGNMRKIPTNTSSITLPGRQCVPTDLPVEMGPPAGPTDIVEEVILSPDGDQCTRPFRLDAYDTSGNISTSFIGVITATRITVNTKVNDLL
jgi:hypothetical protein